MMMVITMVDDCTGDNCHSDDDTDDDHYDGKL